MWYWALLGWWLLGMLVLALGLATAKEMRDECLR